MKKNKDVIKVKTTKGEVSALKSFLKKVFNDESFFSKTSEEQVAIAKQELDKNKDSEVVHLNLKKSDIEK